MGACYDFRRTLSSAEENIFIIESEKKLELSIPICLESVGISLLSEWDVLSFMYRQGASLISADQIARLIGYESTVVVAALDRLEREKLIERSRPYKGMRFYKILASMDASRRRCLQQLVSLTESRAGRVLLAQRLRPTRSEWGRKEPSANFAK